MSPKARVLIGLITTLTLGILGASLILAHRITLGTILLMLAALRLGYVVRQWQRAFADPS